MGERRQTMAQMLERLRSQPPALPPGGGLVAVPDTRTGVDLPDPAGESFAAGLVGEANARLISSANGIADVKWGGVSGEELVDTIADRTQRT